MNIDVYVGDCTYHVEVHKFFPGVFCGFNHPDTEDPHAEWELVGVDFNNPLKPFRSLLPDWNVLNSLVIDKVFEVMKEEG